MICKILPKARFYWFQPCIGIICKKKLRGKPFPFLTQSECSTTLHFLLFLLPVCTRKKHAWYIGGGGWSRIRQKGLECVFCHPSLYEISCPNKTSFRHNVLYFYFIVYCRAYRYSTIFFRMSPNLEQCLTRLPA